MCAAASAWRSNIANMLFRPRALAEADDSRCSGRCVSIRFPCLNAILRTSEILSKLTSSLSSSPLVVDINC